MIITNRPGDNCRKQSRTARVCNPYVAGRAQPVKFYNAVRDHICKLRPPPPDGATARGGPWPPLQYASRPLDSLLCLAIRLHPSFSGPWTRHPAISFLVFLFVLLHTVFRTTSFLGLRCLAFFLYDQAIVFFGI